MEQCTSHDCVENRSEIKRHHEDFERISAICDEIFSLNNNSGPLSPQWSKDQVATVQALRRIRNIIG